MPGPFFLRYRTIVRDASTACTALSNLHRCVSKLLERADKLPVQPDGTPEDQARDSLCRELAFVQGHLGHVLSSLDTIYADERMLFRKRKEKR